MKIAISFLGLLLLSVACVQAQDSTATRRDTLRTQTQSGDDLLAGLTDSVASAQPLLPDRMLLTQRAFWGRKGLFRVMGIAPLTTEGREKELKIRRTMLITHQITGILTLAGMVAQGIVGAQLYKAQGDDYVRIKRTHEAIAAGINISYATTALLSFTAPPPLVGHRRGISSIKLHKYMAFLHLAGMITTNILARAIKEDYTLKPYHRAAAYTTFGAYAVSIIVLKF